MLLNLSVRPSPGSFKVIYESSEWPAPFVEERNAKLLGEMRENHTKCVSVKKQPLEYSMKKVGLNNFATFTGIKTDIKILSLLPSILDQSRTPTRVS